MKKFTLLLILMAVSASTWGCSSIATKVLPASKKVVQGETYLGEKAAFGYHLSALPQELYKYALEKFPICYEYSEKLIISKKPKRYGAAMLGMATLGQLSVLGACDAIISGDISDKSEKIEQVKTYKTGRVLPCGKRSIAANEEFVIQFSESEATAHVKTDADGILDLSHLLFAREGDVYFNIFLKSKNDYYYISTVSLDL